MHPFIKQGPFALVFILCILISSSHFFKHFVIVSFESFFHWNIFIIFLKLWRHPIFAFWWTIQLRNIDGKFCYFLILLLNFGQVGGIIWAWFLHFCLIFKLWSLHFYVSWCNVFHFWHKIRCFIRMFIFHVIIKCQLDIGHFFIGKVCHNFNLWQCFWILAY